MPVLSVPEFPDGLVIQSIGPLELRLLPDVPDNSEIEGRTTNPQKLQLLDLPEEILQKILKKCRSWSHPSLKSKDAVPVDFVPQSEFHLALEHAKFLEVMLTCKKFYRIAVPMFYSHVSVLNPTTRKMEKYQKRDEHYELEPPREGLIPHSSIRKHYQWSLASIREGFVMWQAEIICRARPKMALEHGRAMRIDPRVYLNPCQNRMCPEVYSEEIFKFKEPDTSTVSSLDFVLASPSGTHDSRNVDWRTHRLVKRQLEFFQRTLTFHPEVKSLRLDFVREMLPQSVWADLAKGMVQLKRLRVLTLSHMRLPDEQVGSFHSEEVLQTQKHTGRFGTLVLTDYGRCFQTLDSLINWSQQLEHFTLMLRISPEFLDRNEINLNGYSASNQLMEKLQVLLSPHKATLRTLRLGATLTPRAFSVAVGLSTRSPFHLRHSIVPNFRPFSRLEHLHISLVFAGQQGFRRNWYSLQTDEARNKELQVFDRILPPNLLRLTFDIGDEFSMRHCPVLPDDPSQHPSCKLRCPYDKDVEVFLTKLAERAKMLKRQGKGKLCAIHVNFCMSPFAQAMPEEDLPEGFKWEWKYAWKNFSPWKRLEKVKESVEEHGVHFTFECLEPHCGRPQTHIHPKPILSAPDFWAPRNSTPEQRAEKVSRILRWYYKNVFEYEHEMCSEHVWMRVYSDKNNPGIKDRSG